MGSKRYILIYGAIGGVVLGLLVFLDVASVAVIGAGCLVALLIPLAVGFFVGRQSMAAPGAGLGQAILDSSMAAAWAGVVGGIVTTTISYYRELNVAVDDAVVEVESAIATAATTDLLSLILIGVLTVAIAYFMVGMVGGAIGAALAGNRRGPG